MSPPLTRRVALRTAGGVLSTGLLAGCLTSGRDETTFEIRVRSIMTEDIHLRYNLKDPETGTTFVSESAIIPGGKRTEISYMLTNKVTIPQRIDSDSLELEARVRVSGQQTQVETDNSEPIDLNCDSEIIEILIDERANIEFTDSDCS